MATLKPLAEVARRGVQGVESLVDLGRKYIRAYHSSPHDFERFDMSKIGAGEGAQSYGRGLYFAENPAVSGQGGEYWKQFLGRFPQNEEAAAYRLYENQFDRAKALEASSKNLDQLERAVLDPERTFQDRQRIQAMIDRREAQHELIKGGGPIGPRTYEVNINADPARMLDWDRVLTEQPENVKAALKAMGVNADSPPQYSLQPTPSGKSQYLVHPGGWVTAGNPAPFRNPARAQAVLDEANANYLAKEWGGNVGYSRAQGSFDNLSRDAAAQRVADTFRDYDVPGIRYLDQYSRNDLVTQRLHHLVEGKPAGEFVPPPATRNYVIFDDSLIDIARKYALPGAVGGGFAMDQYRQQ